MVLIALRVDHGAEVGLVPGVLAGLLPDLGQHQISLFHQLAFIGVLEAGLILDLGLNRRIHLRIGHRRHREVDLDGLVAGRLKLRLDVQHNREGEVGRLFQIGGALHPGLAQISNVLSRDAEVEVDQLRSDILADLLTEALLQQPARHLASAEAGELCADGDLAEGLFHLACDIRLGNHEVNPLLRSRNRLNLEGHVLLASL